MWAAAASRGLAWLEILVGFALYADRIKRIFRAGTQALAAKPNRDRNTNPGGGNGCDVGSIHA